MDSESLKILESKYWEGSTSSEEDRELMRHAANPDAALSPEMRHVLSAISDARSVSLDDDFEEAFWRRADEQAQPKPLLLRFGPALRMAAAVVVAIGLGAVLWLSLGSPNQNGVAESAAPVSTMDTYETPEQAFEETKKALMMVSQKFNKGAEPVGEIKRFHSVQVSIATGKGPKQTEQKNHSNDETKQ